MSESKLRALRFEVEDVGKRIKGTKKRYFWSVQIGERFYNFMIDDSLVSGKSKLTINGKVFHQIEKSNFNRSKYSHAFIIDGYSFEIVESEDNFEMKINNKLFTHLLNQEMTTAYFVNHKVEQSDFEIKDQLKQSSSKKITLNLPGMAGAMKKKKAVAQSDNWKQFAGDSNFPNFFGQTMSLQPQIQSKQVIQCQPTQVKEQLKIPSPEQFSTLQNMFKTITDCGVYIPKSSNEKQEEIPTYQVNQIPALPPINLEDFNTMQNLFCTANPCQKVEEKQATTETKTVSTLPKFSDFSTMQQLFSTMKVENPAPQIKTAQTPTFPNININDFNTMQNLFATGFNQLPLQTSVQNQQQSTKDQEQKVNSNKNVPTTNQSYDISSINLNDFNTMQHLFTTNALPLPIKQPVLGNTDKPNKTEQPQKTRQSTQVNSNDFNTMQNLFNTGAGVKKENQFWQF